MRNNNFPQMQNTPIFDCVDSMLQTQNKKTKQSRCWTTQYQIFSDWFLTQLKELEPTKTLKTSYH